MAGEERLRKLARQIEALARSDREHAEKACEIGEQRRRAASALHSICAAFVESVNRLLPQIVLELDPPEYSPESFRDSGANLFQINARGRIVQITFAPTRELISTERFKIPHILEGEVRAYNQEMLKRVEIQEQALFFCLEKAQSLWRVFDRRGYRTGVFNEEFLLEMMERLV